MAPTKPVQKDGKAKITGASREVPSVHLGNLELNLDTTAEFFKSAALAFFVGKKLVLPILSFLGESRRLSMIEASIHVCECANCLGIEIDRHYHCITH